MKLKLIGGNNKKLITPVHLVSLERALKVGRALVHFMKRRSCLGVAANQFGIMERVCAAKIHDDDNHGSIIRFFVNPRIIDRVGSQIGVEGCLSWPGVRGLVNRPAAVTVSFQFYHERFGDELPASWQTTTETFTGLNAVVMSHEIDHLDGIRCIDKMERPANPPNIDAAGNEIGRITRGHS